MIEAMSKEKAKAFLSEMEMYFQKLAIMSKEDSLVQAYMQMALNAHKVVRLIDKDIKHG
jgi:hypothetical protein